MSLRRSSLSIPGNNMRMLAKGADSPADVVVPDLEDSVPPSEKESAREHIREALKSLDFSGKERALRVNGLSTPFAYRDLVLAVETGVEAVVIPKVESPQDIIFVDQILTHLERDMKAESMVTIQVLIESARGVQAVDEISRASGRLTALIFGVGDYIANVGGASFDKIEEAESMLLYPRSRIVIAAASAGLDALDSVYLNFRDTEGLKIDAMRGFRMGFHGKWAIHPSQIDPINEVFTPTLDEFRKAKELVEAYEEAKAKGRGVIVIDNRMVDEANVVLARRQCEMARQLGLWDKLN